MRVDLGEGRWVELRDPESVTNRDRFKFNKRTKPQLIDEVAREQGIPAIFVGQATLGTRLIEAILPEAIVGWSFDLPVPSERADVFEDDGFPFDCYDRIIDACGPYVDALKGKVFSPTGDRGDPTTTSAD